MPVEECPPVQKSLEITAEQCEYLLKSRRSVRVYKNKPVPRDVIARVIEIARYAPTGHNGQDVEWLFIDSREELQHLRKTGVECLRWIIDTQPTLGEELNIKRMLEREESGENVFLRDAPAIIVAHADKNSLIAVVDCTIALSYFDLAARGAGLGCCWNGYLYYMANYYPPMQEAMKLPEGHTTYGCMMIGYPKFSYHRIPLRKQPRITWR
jgi:nitroreductase